jgi:hypothetical protein
MNRTEPNPAKSSFLILENASPLGRSAAMLTDMLASSEIMGSLNKSVAFLARQLDGLPWL